MFNARHVYFLDSLCTIVRSDTESVSLRTNSPMSAVCVYCLCAVNPDATLRMRTPPAATASTTLETGGFHDQILVVVSLSVGAFRRGGGDIGGPKEEEGSNESKWHAHPG